MCVTTMVGAMSVRAGLRVSVTVNGIVRRRRIAMSEDIEFIPFPKMPRWSRDVIVTEKIDGTNACVYVDESGEVRAASRTRWITPEKDNFGFARWVKDHESELRDLGPGRHVGEWWGAGIQRGYGLTERRFSLFSVTRWDNERPNCCCVVPTLYRGPLDALDVEWVMSTLRYSGSRAAEGFTRPEGIVIYHVAAGVGFKKTIEKDGEPKSMRKKEGSDNDS
jgi:hypothetical protein